MRKAKSGASISRDATESRGGCRAKPVRRAHIPKADGRQRPLNVTTLEDKIVQRATVDVLNAIYETDFLGFSHGFRPGRSQHDALDALYAGLLTKKVNWVLGFLSTKLLAAPRSALCSRAESTLGLVVDDHVAKDRSRVASGFPVALSAMGSHDQGEGNWDLAGEVTVISTSTRWPPSVTGSERTA
jgi:hypothetical protein